jgi:hypothetical protein
MNEWARLVDRYASELKKYELVCSYCGQHLSDGNVNVDCPENGAKQGFPGAVSGRSGHQPPTSDVSQHLLFFTDDEPPQDSVGTRKHHFGRPSLRGYKQNPFRS